MSATGKPPPVFLSVIIPAHNEARRLPPAIAAILEFLRAQPYTSELVVVENGSRDDTFARALQSGLACEAGEGFDGNGLRSGEDSHERPARVL